MRCRYQVGVRKTGIDCTYRISSNNSWGDYFFFRTKNGGHYSRDEAIIKGRRLFQILLTENRALNILFYFPIKSKNNHIKNWTWAF